MAGKIYEKPVAFAVLATAVVLVGTIATMAYPMLRPEMHPKLESLRPWTPLQLAGRDVYQREGCMGCHTQQIRPLASEVARYGEYSKAGEFAYDRPFLWGSKRTGPDLAREGGLRPDAWHRRHFANPQEMFEKSNMPRYAFLADAKVDARTVKAHLDALSLPYTEADLAAVEGKTEMDALVAYMQALGTAVPRKKAVVEGASLAALVNPMKDDPNAIARGAKVFKDNCALCHGDEAHGQEGMAPNLLDDRFLEGDGDGTDGDYFAIISGGSAAKASLGRKGYPDGGMDAFGAQLSKEDIWAAITWLRAQKAHESAEPGHVEKSEHGGKAEKH